MNNLSFTYELLHPNPTSLSSCRNNAKQIEYKLENVYCLPTCENFTLFSPDELSEAFLKNIFGIYEYSLSNDCQLNYINLLDNYIGITSNLRYEENIMTQIQEAFDGSIILELLQKHYNHFIFKHSSYNTFIDNYIQTHNIKKVIIYGRGNLAKSIIKHCNKWLNIRHKQGLLNIPCDNDNMSLIIVCSAWNSSLDVLLTRDCHLFNMVDDRSYSANPYYFTMKSTTWIDFVDESNKQYDRINSQSLHQYNKWKQTFQLH